MRWQTQSILGMVCGVALLAGCSPVPTLPPAPMEPAPPTASTTALPQYTIQVGDVLDVRLLLNPAALADALRRAYAKDLQNPRVSVEVKSFAPTRVYVGGEVATPGEFITVGPTLTLSQAIARAGGTKLSSDDFSVFIIRRGPGDKPEFLGTQWKAVRQGRDPNADVRLAPYDVVYVPKMGIAEVYQFYNQYIGQFANPSFGFSYLVGQGGASGGSTVISTPATVAR